MKDFGFDYTTESLPDLSVDDILSEFQTELGESSGQVWSSTAEFPDFAVDMPDGLEEEPEDIKIYGSAPKPRAFSPEAFYAAHAAESEYEEEFEEEENGYYFDEDPAADVEAVYADAPAEEYTEEPEYIAEENTYSDIDDFSIEPELTVEDNFSLDIDITEDEPREEEALFDDELPVVEESAEEYNDEFDEDEYYDEDEDEELKKPVSHKKGFGLASVFSKLTTKKTGKKLREIAEDIAEEDSREYNEYAEEIDDTDVDAYAYAPVVNKYSDDFDDDSFNVEISDDYSYAPPAVEAAPISVEVPAPAIEESVETTSLFDFVKPLDDIQEEAHEASEPESNVSAAAEEARRYIADLQGSTRKAPRRKQRRSLAELQDELDAETQAASGEEEIKENRAARFSMEEQEEREINADSIIEPEYNKEEPEIDSRFNLGGKIIFNRFHFGSKTVDTNADEEYTPSAQNDETMSHWVEQEEQPIDEGEFLGKRRLSKKKQKQLEREEMLRRQAASEESVAEDYYEEEIDDSEYNEYADAVDENSVPQFNIDEDAFPPTFRAYLSSIVASVFLRLRGTRKGVTNSTMVDDTSEDLGAEVQPIVATKYYGSFIISQRLRLRIAFFLLLVLIYISIGLPVPGMLKSVKVIASACCALQLTIMLLALDVVTNAILNAFRLKIGIDTLAVVSCIFTLIDALIVMLVDSAAVHIPLCLLSSFSLYGVFLASAYNTRALRKATRVPAIGKHFYAVTGEIKFKEKQLTLLKSLRSAKGFVRRAEEAPPDENMFSKLTPFIFIFALLLSLILSIVHKNFSDFVFIISAVLAPAVPFTALLAFALPYLLGSNRIFRSGAAIAGWSGLCDIGMSRSLIVTDRDIFPEGSVTMEGVRIFADESAEKVISYAGTLVCASGSSLSSCFAKLMEENGCTMQQVQELEYLSGGGIRGLINGRQVLCGSTDLMHLMNVRIPYRLTNKTSVLLAIDGILYGIFSINYTALPQVRKALVDLVRSSRHPVFAIRDFNVNPEMLHNTFDLATDGYDFPPYVERYGLSEASKVRGKDGKIAAVICNEGLGPLTNVADVGRSIYVSTRINLVISVAASVLCMLISFIKLIATGCVTPGFLFVLMLLFAIPVYIVSLFVLK